MSAPEKDIADAMHEVRLVQSTYAINGDRLKLKALAETFTEDGVLETPTATYHGRAQIEQGLGGGRKAGDKAKSAASHTFTRHHLTTSNLSLTDQTHAAGRTYFAVYTDAGLDHVGFYDDELVLTGAGWKFQRRRVRIDWVNENTVMPALLSSHRQRLEARS